MNSLNINNIKRISILLLLAVTLSGTGCEKKKRLTNSNFNFTITPPAATVVQTGSLTLTAQAGSVPVNPTWSVSSSTIATLNTAIGTSVVLTPQALGDVIVSATFDGVTAVSQIAVVAFSPTSSNVFSVYSDKGLPSGSEVSSDIFLPCTPNGTLTEMSSGYTTEGIRFERASNFIDNEFWGITLDKAPAGTTCGSFVAPVRSKNLSDFSAGTVRFSIRLVNRAVASTESLEIEITDKAGTSPNFALVDGANGFNRLLIGEWQEISIPVSSFGGLNLAEIRVPFAIVMANLTAVLTFDIDSVRWEK